MAAYRIEYASSARAKCNGRQPCKGTTIPKGDLRLGTWVTMRDHGTFKFRHWGCTTPEQIVHMLEALDSHVEELDGFEDLRPDDQAKIKAAFAAGNVDPADVPASAIKSDQHEEGDEVQTPKKRKKAPSKKKAGASEEGENGNPEEEVPRKKKRAYTKKVKPEETTQQAADLNDDALPTKKKRAPKKKVVEAEVPVESGSD